MVGKRLRRTKPGAHNPEGARDKVTGPTAQSGLETRVQDPLNWLVVTLVRHKHSYKRGWRS